MTTLQVIWFILVGVLIAGYGLLGGYDMGVGNLYLANRSAQERKQMLVSIGPFWDANQVWLITVGGALFAAFPWVFATVFSGFYLAMILLLFALIIRTVSIEFRYQLDTPRWNKVWDLCFGVGSLLPSILFGVALGNLMRGIPLSLEASKNFIGTFFSLLNPYALLVGILSFALFTMHGASFLIARSEDSLAEKARGWGQNAWVCLAGLFVVISVWSSLASPHLFENYWAMPVFFVFPGLVVLGLALYPRALKQTSKFRPLGISMLTLLGLVGTLGASLYPRFVPDLNTVGQFQSVFVQGYDPTHLERSLIAFNASSSSLTLTVMLIIAGIGIPVMLAYTAYVYRAMLKSPEISVDSSDSTESLPY